jgi:hypothetical protein
MDFCISGSTNAESRLAFALTGRPVPQTSHTSSVWITRIWCTDESNVLTLNIFLYLPGLASVQARTRRTRVNGTAHSQLVDATGLRDMPCGVKPLVGMLFDPAPAVLYTWCHGRPGLGLRPVTSWPCSCYHAIPLARHKCIGCSETIYLNEVLLVWEQSKCTDQ